MCSIENHFFNLKAAGEKVFVLLVYASVNNFRNHIYVYRVNKFYIKKLK